MYGAIKAAQRGFGEALRYELKGTGVGLTMVYPGMIQTSPHDQEKECMPSWYRPDRTVPPEPLAEAIVQGIEKGRCQVFYPRNVRLLRVVHGLTPGLADVMLRRLTDRSAAP